MVRGKKSESIISFRESDLFSDDEDGPRVTYTLVYAAGHSRGGVPYSLAEYIHVCEITTEGRIDGQIRWHSSGATLCQMRAENAHGYLIAVKAVGGTDKISCPNCRLRLSAIRRHKLDELAARRREQERTAAIALETDDADGDQQAEIA